MDRSTGGGRPAAGNRQFQKGANIAARLLLFGAEALRLAAQLPRNAFGRHVGLQWIRCATSAGANYEEARAAESRADFIHKVSISTKEMREACYWIGLVRCSRLITASLEDHLREAEELAAILGASARTARARAADEPEPNR